MPVALHFPRCEAKKGFQNPTSGVYYGEAPPVPIPNTEVKLTRADNTRRAASREDRSMPLQKKNGFLAVLFLLLTRLIFNAIIFINKVKLIFNGIALKVVQQKNKKFQ